MVRNQTDLFKSEYNKLSTNKIILNTIDLGQSMQDIVYEQVEWEQNGMKVRFEFPKNSSNEELIVKEVETIMLNTLKEYLANNIKTICVE